MNIPEIDIVRRHVQVVDEVAFLKVEEAAKVSFVEGVTDVVHRSHLYVRHQGNVFFMLGFELCQDEFSDVLAVEARA